MSSTTTTTCSRWNKAKLDAWGGVAEWRYFDTEYLVSRGGDRDRFWVIQNEETGEWLACEIEGHALPTRRYAGLVIEAHIRSKIMGKS